MVARVFGVYSNRKAWAGNTCLEKELHHPTLLHQVIQAILNAKRLTKQDVFY